MLAQIKKFKTSFRMRHEQIKHELWKKYFAVFKHLLLDTPGSAVSTHIKALYKRPIKGIITSCKAWAGVKILCIDLANLGFCKPLNIFMWAVFATSLRAIFVINETTRIVQIYLAHLYNIMHQVMRIKFANNPPIISWALRG